LKEVIVIKADGVAGHPPFDQVTWKAKVDL
jgi:hypothetical protein